MESIEEPRVLSIDGGGIRGFASLVILKAIMDVLSPEEKPCEYFHLIGGAGIGGVLALLLGRLRLSVSDCMIEYWRLSSTIIRQTDLNASPPLFDARKLRIVMDDIVERHTNKERPNDRLLADPQPRNCTRTCVFAVKVAQNEKTPYCFRTYDLNGTNHEDEVQMSTLSITDVVVAATAAEGLFEEATLYSDNNEPIKFLDTLFPLGLNDPTLLLVQEYNKVFSPNSVSTLISVGHGRVANDDISHPLRLGKPTSPPALILPSLYHFLEAGYNMVRGCGKEDKTPGATTDGELQLDGQYQGIIQDVPLEVYRRFDIGPIPDVGPNDFLSVKEVGDAADEYLQSIHLPSSRSYLRRGDFEALCWAMCTDNSEVTDAIMTKLYRQTKVDVTPEKRRWDMLRQLLPEKYNLLNETLWNRLLLYDRSIANEKYHEMPLLHLAVHKGYDKMINTLLEVPGIDINAEDGRGFKPLHTAVLNGNERVVELLLEKGADTNAIDQLGNTPLHFAILKGKERVVKLLLEKGASIYAEDGDFVHHILEKLHGEGASDMLRILIAGLHDKRAGGILKFAEDALGYVSRSDWSHTSTGKELKDILEGYIERPKGAPGSSSGSIVPKQVPTWIVDLHVKRAT